MARATQFIELPRKAIERDYLPAASNFHLQSCDADILLERIERGCHAGIQCVSESCRRREAEGGLCPAVSAEGRRPMTRSPQESSQEFFSTVEWSGIDSRCSICRCRVADRWLTIGVSSGPCR